jgi:hypothetical protein
VRRAGHVPHSQTRVRDLTPWNRIAEAIPRARGSIDATRSSAPQKRNCPHGLQTGTHDFRRPGNDRDFEDARSPRHRDLDIGTHVDIGTHDLTSGTCPLRDTPRMSPKRPFPPPGPPPGHAIAPLRDTRSSPNWKATPRTYDSSSESVCPDVRVPTSDRKACVPKANSE